ncbi:MAG TPA: acyl-CoA reductase [Candidatus Methylacidiphilales bacterium]|jgi:hypothetical protein|nr:acyl-CoA reductase [Candidatus Methylacidiphilales bacterium]
MTTRQRIDLLARAYPRLFPRAELLRLVREQLGHFDALDRWVVRGGKRVRAQPPRLIYHICAGNLAVSAMTSIAHGLILGAANIVKLPGIRDGDAATFREISVFVQGLPKALRGRVATHSHLNEAALSAAHAVIAFGSDATMTSIREKLRFDQKFIAHGHAVSLLWMGDPKKLTPKQARACAVDVLTYDQLGCLSPQVIYVPPGTNIAALGEKLALALETDWQSLAKKPARPLSVAARIAEARDVAFARGHRVWLPPSRHPGWTLIHDPDPTFSPSPLHGVIPIRAVAESKIARALNSVRGRISTVGIAGRMSSRLEKDFLSLGVSRFCPAGRMQFPPLTWHHDGRQTLAELVTWIDAEGPA